MSTSSVTENATITAHQSREISRFFIHPPLPELRRPYRRTARVSMKERRFSRNDSALEGHGVKKKSGADKKTAHIYLNI